MSKLNGQLASFKNEPTLEKAKAILQKVRNNRVTSPDFCDDIEEDLEEVRMYIAKMEQEQENVHVENTQSNRKNQEKVMSELVGNYQTVTPQERQEGMSQLKQLRQRIQQITQVR